MNLRRSDDATLKFDVNPAGDQRVQIAVFIVMWLVPLLTAVLAVFAYVRFFYRVKLNEIGIVYNISRVKGSVVKFLGKSPEDDSESSISLEKFKHGNMSTSLVAEEASTAHRRTILLATIEYDIEDWNIKVKIGGLGVMVIQIFPITYNQ